MVHAVAPQSQDSCLFIVSFLSTTVGAPSVISDIVEESEVLKIGGWRRRLSKGNGAANAYIAAVTVNFATGAQSTQVQATQSLDSYMMVVYDASLIFSRPWYQYGTYKDVFMSMVN